MSNTEKLEELGHQTEEEKAQFQKWMDDLRVEDPVSFRKLHEKIVDAWYQSGHNARGYWKLKAEVPAIEYKDLVDGVRYVFRMRQPFQLINVEGKEVMDMVAELYDKDHTEVDITVHHAFTLEAPEDLASYAQSFVDFVLKALAKPSNKV